jgi:membrane protein
LTHDRGVPFASSTREVLADTRRRLHGCDLALGSAGATLYGALAVVPSLLAAVALAAVLLGRSDIHHYGALLAGTLPQAMGAPAAADRIVEAALELTPLGILLAVGMGTAYGDGLSRAFQRIAPAPAPDGARPPAWWIRAATLPLLGLAPLMLTGLLVATPFLAGVNASSGKAGVALASYLSLTLVWILTWLPLTWAFRVVAPGRPRWRSALAGAVVTGAFVSGFLQGFVLFLALPVDLGRPFGGLVGVGVVSALLLWLWVLHAVVLVGYAFTRAVDDHVGRRASERGASISVPAREGQVMRTSDRTAEWPPG